MASTQGASISQRGTPGSQSASQIAAAGAPKRLARGPLWARLPPLRPLAPLGSGSLSHHPQPQSPNDPQSTLNTAAPTHEAGANANAQIAFPDRVSTTRVLLQDTQACIQKLSARMDTIASRNEQAVKEVELSRVALDASGERCVADVTDAGESSDLSCLRVRNA